MYPDPDIPRRVRQNTTDIVALYDLLDATNKTVKSIAETQAEHGRRLDTIDVQLISISTTQAEHGRRLDTIDARLDKVDGRLDKMDTTLQEILGLLRTH